METNSLGLLHQYLSKKNVRVHLGERQQFTPPYMVLNQGAHVEKTRCKSLSRTSNEPHPHIYQPGAPECSKLGASQTQDSGSIRSLLCDFKPAV